MGCSCEIDCVFDLHREFYKSVRRKARKNHKCSECRTQIAKGDEYESTSGKWGADIMTFKTCKDCLSLINHFFPNGYVIELVRMYVKEFIGELDGGVPESCIADLTPGARAFVCDVIEECWENITDGEVE